MVSTALYTGLSGLRLHQNYIDVIGNNLANVSTAGFRGSRPTFSDLLSYTARSGTAANGSLGGQNPMQIGHGAMMSTVDIDTSQGTFQDTGRPLDVAIQGHGFFTLTDGNQRYYSRVGTFGIDNAHSLVDLRTGMQVMSSNGSTITVPVGDTLPAHATTSVSFQGNLPARVSGPLEEIIQSSSALKEGTPAHKRATGTAGTGNQFDLTAFAGKTVLVRIGNSAQTTITFDAATFGAGPVNASTVAARFAVAGLSVTANDAAGTIDFDTIELGQTAKLKFDDGSQSTGMLASLGLSATLVAGTESTATAASSLNALTARTTPYAPGDQISIRGTNPDGTAFSDTFVFGAANNGTTLQDLVTFINQTIDNTQATAELTTDGHLRLVATDKEPAEMSMIIGDATGNSGRVDWSDFRVSQNGTGPDTATTSIDVVDAQGLTHNVTMTFTRSTSDPAVWNMTAGIDASEGSVTQPTIGQIRFNSDGSFNVIGGGTNSLSFAWNGTGGTQSVAVNLGSSGMFDGIAMLGATATVAATDQDGFGSGTLLNVAFDTNGNLNGFYSNGQSQLLETLRISVFANEAGLARSGDTLFVASPNSDDAISTTANIAGAGSIRPGALENSNVDIAREFVNLIEAQRGFQANSRVITTADQILADLMNIVR
ncbi:MAG: flagellar hook-basal body complex protein [Planctomycetota bacterium]|nr:flagellar hook-basal body complex protein [Planctomycetota bacterium]